jgi:hypothetical protein
MLRDLFTTRPDRHLRRTSRTDRASSMLSEFFMAFSLEQWASAYFGLAFMLYLTIVNSEGFDD